MALNYLLVDDESDQVIESIMDRLELTAQASGRELRITRHFPASFEAEVESLAAPDERFGVLLDHRLDQRPIDDHGTFRHYRGGSLAQEVRSRDADSPDWRRWAFPIVLVSLRSRIQGSYRPDTSVQDVFDLVVAKESVAANASVITEQLFSLVDGYAVLRRVRENEGLDPTAALLGANAPIAALDPRFVDRLARQRTKACHAGADFLLRQFLGRPGILIEELVLAARLGVKAEGEAWKRLLSEHLHPFCYDGAFASGWPRWWARSVDNWWAEKVRTKPIRTSNALERVAALRAFTGLGDLEAAQPAHAGYGTKFWTVCQETSVPLDLTDGVRLAEGDEPEPWQEPRYISLAAAVQGVGGAKVHPIDRPKVDALREDEGEELEEDANDQEKAD